MIEASNLRLPLDAGLPQGQPLARKALAKALGVPEHAIGPLTLLKRSVDARKKSDVHFVASYAFELLEGSEAALVERGAKAPVNVKIHRPYGGYDLLAAAGVDAQAVRQAADGEGGQAAFCPVVVGTGPAGLFAAWALAQAGAKPVVIERGQRVEERLDSVDAFNQGGALNPESNIQFGEGGAGTFSDGKLNTGIKNPRCKDVLHIFVQAGAPQEILWQAKPHIGTDLLVDVVRAMRQSILEAGGQVLFDTRLDAVHFAEGAVSGVVVTDVLTGQQRVVPATDVVLACGHSARDTFAMLKGSGLLMERKPFSVGVRIEHPQQLINESQYGAAASHPALGSADYKLSVHLPDGRGVYTFCMCPGGEVVCAASEEGGVCVNGMSRFARDGENANSAVLVGVEVNDLPGNDVLAGVELQRAMERAAYDAGHAATGKAYMAPAQYVGDFLAGKASCADGLRAKGVKPTYARGVAWCNLHDVLPQFVAQGIQEALPLFDRRLRGFAAADAVMTGVETRSSSPVRVVRDKATYQAFFACGEGQEPRAAQGLYPCGEGAGYAGGIMSAAVDGLRAAEALLANRFAE